MTVSRLRAELDNSEFVYWTRYYARKQQREELARKMGD